MTINNSQLREAKISISTFTEYRIFSPKKRRCHVPSLNASYIDTPPFSALLLGMPDSHRVSVKVLQKQSF